MRNRHLTLNLPSLQIQLFCASLVLMAFVRWHPVVIGLLIALIVLALLVRRRPSISGRYRTHFVLLGTVGGFYFLRCLQYYIEGGQISNVLTDMASVLTAILSMFILSKFPFEQAATTLLRCQILGGVMLTIFSLGKAASYFTHLDLASSGALGAPGGWAVTSDYNLYALCIFCSVVSSYVLFRRRVWSLLLITLPFAITIYFSGSRRMMLGLTALQVITLAMGFHYRIRSWIVTSFVSLGLLTTIFIHLVQYRQSSSYIENPRYESLWRAFVSPSTRYENLIVYHRLHDPPSTGSKSDRQGSSNGLLMTGKASKENPENEGEKASRLARWRYGLETISHGFSWTDHIAGKSALILVQKFSHKFTQNIDHPHNFVITSYFTTGLVSTSILLYLILTSFYHLLRKPNPLKAGLAVQLFFGISFSLTSGLSLWSLLLCVVLLIFSLRENEKT